MGASSENFCLRWNDFESNVSGAFRDLRQEADFFDVTLGCPDGKSLQAHKVILSACSSTFKTMLRDTQRNTNSHHPYIFLRGVSFPDLSAVLDFMYHGEVNVAQEDLNSFLAVAEELQIKGLTQKEGGEPSKPKPSGSGAVKRPVQPSSENVSASSTPAVKKIRRSSPDLPEQGQIKTIDIKSDPEAGPSGASQAVNRDGGASADYADESGDFEDYGDYYGEGEGGDNGADGSMMEGGEEGAGGKGVFYGTETKRRFSIVQHVIANSNGLGWSCALCDYSNPHSKNETLNHVVVNHGQNYGVECPHCHRVYKNKQSLASHVSAHCLYVPGRVRKPDVHVQVQCQYCSKFYKNATTLNVHKYTCKSHPNRNY